MFGLGTSASSFSNNEAETANCYFTLKFSKWGDIFYVVLLSYGWNAAIILWLMPWRRKFPYLGATLEALFQSDAMGISLKNWRQLGTARLDVDYIRQLANRKDFQFYCSILVLNVWTLFFAKLAMYFTFSNRYIVAFEQVGFTDFFNIEIACVTLLMISTEFFSFTILPALQVGARYSIAIKAFLYLIYVECVCTFVLLCIEWPLLISVLYIGACIVLTGMILSMAVLCLLAGVIVSGSVIYWLISCIFCWLPYYYGSQWKVNIRAFSASITWLFITLLIWVSGICLSFLFTDDQFESYLCLDGENDDQMLAAGLILLSLTWTIFSLLFIGVANFTSWHCSDLLDFGAENRNVRRDEHDVRNRNIEYQTINQADDIETDEKDREMSSGLSGMDEQPIQLSDQNVKDLVDAIPDSD